MPYVSVNICSFGSVHMSVRSTTFPVYRCDMVVPCCKWDPYFYQRLALGLEGWARRLYRCRGQKQVTNTAKLLCTTKMSCDKYPYILMYGLQPPVQLAVQLYTCQYRNSSNLVRDTFSFGCRVVLTRAYLYTAQNGVQRAVGGARAGSAGSSVYSVKGVRSGWSLPPCNHGLITDILGHSGPFSPRLVVCRLGIPPSPSLPGGLTSTGWIIQPPPPSRCCGRVRWSTRVSFRAPKINIGGHTTWRR